MVARVERSAEAKLHVHEPFGDVPAVVGPTTIKRTLPARGLAPMFEEIATKIRSGNYTVPAVLVKVAGAWSRTKIADAIPSSFAAALFLELVRDTGTLEAVGFDMACGCGLRVEVIR